MPQKRFRPCAVPRAKGPGHGRRHRAAQSTTGHHLIQHEQGEDQRHGRQRLRAEAPHEPHLRHAHYRLHQEGHHIWRGQACQQGKGRRAEHRLGARVHRAYPKN